MSTWTAKSLKIGGINNPNHYAEIKLKDEDEITSFMIHTTYEELSSMNPNYWVSVRDINNILRRLDILQYVNDIEDSVMSTKDIGNDSFILSKRLVKALDWLGENHIYFRHEPSVLYKLKKVLNQINMNIKKIMYIGEYSYPSAKSIDELHGIDCVTPRLVNGRAFAIVQYPYDDCLCQFNIHIDHKDNGKLWVCVSNIENMVGDGKFIDFSRLYKIYHLDQYKDTKDGFKEIMDVTNYYCLTAYMSKKAIHKIIKLIKKQDNYVCYKKMSALEHGLALIIANWEGVKNRVYSVLPSENESNCDSCRNKQFYEDYVDELTND